MRALESRRVVVTRPPAQAVEICRMLESAGALPVLVPTIGIEPPASFEPLDRALRSAEEYDWVVFTSATGVQAVLRRTATLDVGLATSEPKLAAVGPATARALSDSGLTVAATPGAHRADQIPDALGDLRGVRILLPRSDLADESLPSLLRALGAQVDAVAAYRTTMQAVTPTGLAVLEQGVDAITFTSPSTVRGLLEGLGSAGSRLMGDAVVASIGPVTSVAARELGVRVHVEARESTSRGLVDALATYQGWVRHTSSTAT